MAVLLARTDLAVVAMLGSCSVLSELRVEQFDGPVPTSIALGLVSGGLAVGLLSGVAGLEVWFVMPIAVIIWVLSAVTISWIAGTGYLPFDAEECRTL